MNDHALQRLRTLEAAARRYRDTMVLWGLCARHPNSWNTKEHQILKASTLPLSRLLNGYVGELPEPVRDAFKVLLDAVDAHAREFSQGEAPHDRAEGGRVTNAVGVLTQHAGGHASQTAS